MRRAMVVAAATLLAACGGGNGNPSSAACAPGGSCTPMTPDACKVFTTSCDATMTVATCRASGDQPEGAACASGVCSTGQCIAACVPAQGCSGSDPCLVYGVECNATHSAGTCVAGLPAVEGTSCGSGLVCRSDATCVAACLAGVACTPAGTPDPCQDYTTACNSSLTVTSCVASAKPDQTACGPATACQAASSCQSGACVTGAPVGCDDLNPCTADSCSLAGGCAHAVNDNGTACAGGVCGNGHCNACVAGVACASANPCHAAAIGCATGVPVCSDTGNAADGTACGASMACAAGTCVASTRMVSGTWPTTYWLDDGTRIDVDELVGVDSKIAAIVGTGAGATRIAGTLLPNGTFSILGVPFGAYVLEFIHPGFAPLYAEETDSILDLGVDWMGRPDAALASLSGQVTVNVSGLTPWAIGDGFIVTAPNVSRGSAGALGPINGASIAGSATAGSFAYDSRAVATNGGFGMVDTSKGDDLWIHQMVAASVSPGTGGTLSYLRAGPSAHLIAGVTIQNGLAASIGSAAAPIPLQAPPAMGNAPVHFAGTQFAARGLDTNPLARRVTFERVNVLAAPHGLARPAPQNLDSVPPRVPLLQAELTGTPFQDADTDFGTLTYGSGFLGGFTEWRLANRIVNVPLVAPGATGSFTIGGGLGRADAMPAPSPIVPVLSPPLLPQVNGNDARSFQGDIGLTPTLAWSPPTLGSPSFYVVIVWELAAGAGGATTGTQVAQYRTSSTSFTMPPGVLLDDRSYALQIVAFQNSAGAAVFTAPRRRGLSPAWGIAVTGLLRTCSTGSCHPCTDGAACVVANPCHVGAISCANGFLCADTLVNLPDGTACGAGNTCSAGTCSPTPTRTVTITENTSWWADAGKTVIPQTAAQIWVRYGTGAGASRVQATAAVPGVAIYTVPNVPVGRYLVEAQPTTYSPMSEFYESTRDSLDLGWDVYGRPDAMLASVSTPVTLNFSNMAPWTASSDLIEYFSANAGMVDYRYALGDPVPWAAGATSGTGIEEYFDGSTPLISPAAGDTTWFTQLTSRTVTSGATTYVYKAVDRYAFSSTFSVADGVASTFDVPFLVPTSTTPVPIDFRLSQFAALVSSVHPAAVPSLANFAVVVQPYMPASPPFQPLPFRSYGGWPDLLLFNPTDLQNDANLGTTSFGQFLPSPWAPWRMVYYGTQVAFLATGATKAYMQSVSMFSYEALAGASTPVVPVVSPPRAPLVNGNDAFAGATGVGTTPTLSWTAPAIGPAVGPSTSYRVALFRLGNVAGTTKKTAVANFFGLTTTSLQVPAGLLVAGQQYFAVIGLATGAMTWDQGPRRLGLPWHQASCVTGIIVP